MKVIYLADDGTQFDNEWECEYYEYKCSLHHLDEVHVYSKEGIELFPFDENGEPDDKFYTHSDLIIIETEEALDDLHNLADYCGWCWFEDTLGVGKWKFVYKKYENEDVIWEEIKS